MTYPPRMCRLCQQPYQREDMNDICHCRTARACKDCHQPYFNKDRHTLRCASCMEVKRQAYKKHHAKPPLKRLHRFNPDNLNSFYFSHHENEERKRKLYRRLFGA